MLEVKNLVKEYRPKKGKTVRAVDGISIKFPEKGMVFILGKSGSGKSTLLNLLGGLDKYDGGEIIIKGKSSKDFSQSEFDSYRNTYLGFIFQEYNILNDFNVAQNIAIALQLQGQKATDERINGILKEVDLEGYGGRKPSELSGGQKQRVAIARALVKNPEIIMADEPTGALDSKTGLQVFDTLKRLSRDKLVITITHDRDFAEMYGDRVIELKDGKVISDIEKYTASAQEFSPGMKVTDDKVISIRKGYVLTEKDVELINAYLQKNEILLSADDKTNGDLKRFARINDDGEKESFRTTDESAIEYGEEKKFRLIKSRLPLKNKIVIGASGLKNKPIRLIVTILLSVVAFTMFGLADTLAAYNKIKATEKSIEDSGLTSAAFTKTIKRTEGEGSYSYEYFAETRFGDDDVTAFTEKTGMEFYPVLSAPVNGIGGYLAKADRGNYYYSTEFCGAMEVTAERLGKLGFSYVGTLPTAKDEIAVSKHFFDAFAAYGYRDGDREIKAEEVGTPAHFLAQRPAIRYGERALTVTAIVDTKFNEEKYSSLNTDESTTIDVTDFFLQQEKASDVEHGYHGMMFVGSELWRELKEKTYTDFSVYMASSDVYFNVYGHTTLSAVRENGKVWFAEATKTEMNEGEVIINVIAALNAINNHAWTYYNKEDEKASKMINDIDRYVSIKRYETDVDAEYYRLNGVTVVTDEDMDRYMEREVMPYLRSNADLFTAIPVGLYVDGEYKGFDADVVGVFMDVTDETSDTKIVFAPDAEEFVRGSEDKKYSFVISLEPTKEQWKKLVELHYAEAEDGVGYSMKNGVIFTVSMLNDVVESLSEVFLYVGIGFALFAALMLTNFISTSIVYKRREIGILRAVGARGSDVYGIFAIESVIIAMINFVLSSVVTGVVAYIIGSSFRNEYHISISILNFGVRQVGLIFGVALLVALVASFLPTFRISRQKPVDAIKK